MGTSTTSNANNAPVVKQSSVMGTFDASKHQKFLSAINTKDPLTLPTLEEQGASISAKLIRLNANSDYQKLDARGRLYIRSKFYDKYVVPSYTKAGVKPPDMKTWLLGTTTDQIGKINPEEAFQSKSIQASHDFIASTIGGGTKLVMAGAALTHGLVQKALGLDKYFNGFLPKFMQDYSVDANDPMVKTEDKYFDKMKSAVDSVSNTQNFYLENHPRKGFLASAPSWTGEQVAMLPLYEAINPATEAAGAAVTSGAAKLLPNLTQKLLASPVGKFVGRRLIDAATGFISGKTLGESNKQATADATAFAVGGGLGEGAEKLFQGTAQLIRNSAKTTAEKSGETATNNVYQYATDADIKIWTAQQIAMGGKPFVEAAHAQAVLEAGQDRVLADSERAKSLPVDTASKINTERSVREQHDPVTHKVVQAERYTLNSLAKRHYGAEYGDLSRGKRDIIKQRRIELMHEAAYELPALVPDLNKAEVEHNHTQQIADSPSYAALSKMIQDSYPEMDQVSVVNQEQVEANQIITGIKDNEKKAIQIQEFRPLGAALHTESGKINERGFAQHRVDSISYFKNKNAGFKDRRAVDGTLIGGRDKRTWNERMKSENFEQFINTLKESDGDFINFESPYHRMLYHWANRRSLPTPVRDKLARSMKYWLENQKNPIYASTKDLNESADWNLVHLTKLAQSGRLTAEGNQFRSTMTNGPGSFTKWQGELQTELEEQEFKHLKQTLTLYPDQKKLLTNAMNMLQENRANAKTPQEWMDYNSAINQHLKLGGIN